jgi:hypothetical protein
MRFLIYPGLFIFLLSNTSSAQQQVPRFSAQILAGISISVGSFGSKEANGLYADNYTKASGLANSGPSFQFNMDYLIKKSFGISFSIADQSNKQDNAAFQNNIRQSLNTNDQFVVTTNSWQIVRIMAGLFYEVPIPGKKFSFRPKFLMGGLKTSIPAFKFYDTTSYTYSENFSKIPLSWSFCYEIGAGFQWHISKKLFISADIDFYHSAPGGYNITGQYVNYYQDTKIPISSINIMAGLGFRI